MPESAEIQMARLQEQLKSVIATLAEDREDRKERDKQLTQIAVSISNLDRRLEAVEHQMAAASPTIQEFITIKHKVVGAGIFGKWAWALGGATIAVIYSGREAIRSFFMH